MIFSVLRLQACVTASGEIYTSCTMSRKLSSCPTRPQWVRGTTSLTLRRKRRCYALEQFPPGKDRSSLIGAALSQFPPEDIGFFLTSMERSTVEGDLKETARLISDEHVLGRPQIRQGQLQQFVDGVHSPELRAALLTGAAERPRSEASWTE